MSSRTPQQNELLKQIGWALRERRRHSGMTLYRLSERCGVSLGYLSQIELARNVAGVFILQRICAALGVHLDFLFSRATYDAYRFHLQQQASLSQSADLCALNGQPSNAMYDVA